PSLIAASLRLRPLRRFDRDQSVDVNRKMYVAASGRLWFLVDCAESEERHVHHIGTTEKRFPRGTDPTHGPHLRIGPQSLQRNDRQTSATHRPLRQRSRRDGGG